MRCIFDVRSGILKMESDLWFVGETRAFGFRSIFLFFFLSEVPPFSRFLSHFFIGIKCSIFS